MIFSSGMPETACGAGSTLAATANLRARLPPLLRGLGVRSLLDAPCGDCNWIVRTDLSMLDDYVGIDNFEAHIHRAADRIADMDAELLPAKTMSAYRRDIFAAPWPCCEAVLSRDFLQHWPASAISGFLARFLESGAVFLLCTSHAVTGDDIETPGGFAPRNLCGPPVLWPLPLEEIEDGPGRIVGLWHRDMFAREAAA